MASRNSYSEAVNDPVTNLDERSGSQEPPGSDLFITSTGGAELVSDLSSATQSLGGRQLPADIPQANPAELPAKAHQASPPRSPKPAGVFRLFGFENGKLVFDHRELRQLLDVPEFQSKPVVVVSMAGKLRQGKSLALNIMARFLLHVSNGSGYNNASTGANWLDNGRLLQEGIPWRSGEDSHTKGIWLWKRPILYKLPDGDEIVILLMDTQGLLDESAVAEGNKIFALSALVSSVQIFNISKGLDKGHVDHFRYLTDFAETLHNQHRSDEYTEKPFQKLIFLVRDWQYTERFGFVEGENHLRKWLDIVPQFRSASRNAFRERIECCLLPHPGRKVASPSFNGLISSMDEEFVDEIKRFTEHVLSSKCLYPRSIAGVTLTCDAFYEYIQQLAHVTENGNLPSSEMLSDIIFQRKVEMLADQLLNEYCTKMKNAEDAESRVHSATHANELSDALANFRRATKDFGTTASFVAEWEKKLARNIQAKYEVFQLKNELRFLSKTAKDKEAEIERLRADIERTTAAAKQLKEDLDAKNQNYQDWLDSMRRSQQQWEMLTVKTEENRRLQEQREEEYRRHEVEKQEEIEQLRRRNSIMQQQLEVERQRIERWREQSQQERQADKAERDLLHTAMKEQRDELTRQKLMLEKSKTPTLFKYVSHAFAPDEYIFSDGTTCTKNEVTVCGKRPAAAWAVFKKLKFAHVRNYESGRIRVLGRGNDDDYIATELARNTHFQFPSTYAQN